MESVPNQLINATAQMVRIGDSKFEASLDQMRRIAGKSGEVKVAS